MKTLKAGFSGTAVALISSPLAFSPSDQLSHVAVEVVELVVLIMLNDIRDLLCRQIVGNRHDALVQCPCSAELGEHPLACNGVRAEQNHEFLASAEIRFDRLLDAIPALEVDLIEECSHTVAPRLALDDRCH